MTEACIAACTKAKPYTFGCKAFSAGAIPKELSSTMGLLPFGRDRSALPGPAKLRRAARVPPRRKMLYTCVFKRKSGPKRRGKPCAASRPEKEELSCGCLAEVVLLATSLALETPWVTLLLLPTMTKLFSYLFLEAYWENSRSLRQGDARRRA